MSAKRGGLVLATLVSLSACTTAPNVMVLPGVGKPFEEFQRDDVVCRQWAAEQAETQKMTSQSTKTATKPAIRSAQTSQVIGASRRLRSAAVGTRAIGTPRTRAPCPPHLLA